MRHVLLASFTTLVFAIPGSPQGYVDILPDDIKNPFIERYKSIVKELETAPASDWSGTYTRHVGETWSDLLVLDSPKGFAAFRDTCSDGPRAWVNYGGASFSNGVLHLAPERKNGAEYVYDLPSTEFTLVRWGTERWLVPSNKLALFAYAVNSRSDHPYEIAYVKDSQQEKERPLRPELPPSYMPLLRLPTINARVVAIGKASDDRLPRMTIDSGTNRGVIEGMKFWLVGHRGIHVSVEVVEVGEKSAVVSVRGWGVYGPALMKEIVPVVGWRFRSRP